MPKIIVDKKPAFSGFGIGTAITDFGPVLTAAQKKAWGRRVDMTSTKSQPLYPRPGNPGVWGTAGPGDKPVVVKGGGGVSAAVARAKAAALAAKGGKSGATNAGDTGKVAISQAPPATAPDTGMAQADLISKYNLARAEILKSMGGDIQGIYGAATDDLAKVVGGSTQDVRDRLFQMGGNGNTSTTARGNDFVENNQGALDRIAGSYNADAIKNAAYTLGASIPGESLAKQGAAYGAAAAFAPGAALQEGQYAIQSAIQKALDDAKVTNEDASKVSASTSKLLGYVADAYGNPIAGKDGKPVSLQEAQLTPYQQASLGIRAAELKVRAGQIDYGRYKDDRAYAQKVDAANRTDRRYYAGLQLREASTKLAIRKAGIEEGRIDSAASKTAGYVVLRDGSIPRQKNGQPYAVAKTAAEKKKPTVSAAALQRAATMADNFYNGIAAVTRADGTVSKAKVDAVKYQPALRRLKAIVGYEKAREILDSIYPYGEKNGRPLIDAEARKALLAKKGVTKAMLTRLQNNYWNSTTPQGKKAAMDAIEKLVGRLN